MSVTAYFINENDAIDTVEGVLNGTNYEFYFAQKSFIFGLIKDGQRATANELKPLEKYACTVNGKRFEIEEKDLSNAGRTLVINQDLFFLIKPTPTAPTVSDLQAVLESGVYAEDENRDSWVLIDPMYLGDPAVIFNLDDGYGYTNYTNFSSQIVSHDISDDYGRAYTQLQASIGYLVKVYNYYNGNRSNNLTVPNPQNNSQYSATFMCKEDETETANQTYYFPTKINGQKADSNGRVNVFGSVPASATDSGIVGQMAIDSNFLYVCTALNTWVRSPLTTW